MWSVAEALSRLIVPRGSYNCKTCCSVRRLVRRPVRRDPKCYVIFGCWMPVPMTASAARCVSRVQHLAIDLASGAPRSIADTYAAHPMADNPGGRKRKSARAKGVDLVSRKAQMSARSLKLLSHFTADLHSSVWRSRLSVAALGLH